MSAFPCIILGFLLPNSKENVEFKENADSVSARFRTIRRGSRGLLSLAFTKLNNMAPTSSRRNHQKTKNTIDEINYILFHSSTSVDFL